MLQLFLGGRRGRLSIYFLGRVDLQGMLHFVGHFI
jgi:hypothetical protein